MTTREIKNLLFSLLLVSIFSTSCNGQISTSQATNNINSLTKNEQHQKMIDFVGSDLHHYKHLAAFSQKVEIKEMAPLKEAIHNNRLFRFSV